MASWGQVFASKMTVEDNLHAMKATMAVTNDYTISETKKVALIVEINKQSLAMLQLFEYHNTVFFASMLNSIHNLNIKLIRKHF